MNIKIIAVGKKHSPDLVEAINKYQKRMTGQNNILWQIVPPISTGQQQKLQESQKLLERLKPDDFVILLDEAGEILSNNDLAKLLSSASTQADIKNLVFVIGGAYGVSDELKDRANFIWSLSKLVFPHQLVRLILLEQIYRTFAIINNHPYHHD